MTMATGRADQFQADLLREALRRGLPGGAIVTDPDVLASLSSDEAEWAPVGPGRRRRSAPAPRPTSQHVVRACAELGVAVVPRGAGTGLSGGANAVDGCLILDLSRMNQVVEIDADNLIAVVQPGVVNDDLKAAVAEHGLWYPPDPASAPWSTIGGNVATNAGGLCCLKYGVTRDYVLGLRAVVGGPAGYGTAARLGGRTTKGVAGLRPGRAVRRLGGHARRDHRDHPAAAARAGGRPAHGRRRVRRAGRRRARRSPLVTRRGLDPSALELLDRTTPAGGRGVEAPGPGGRRRGAAAGPDRHPRRGRRRGGRRGGRRVRATPARCGRRSPPTRSRPRRCSRPAGWPTRRWSGSARC